VRAVGKTSLGIAYALQMTDVTLASGVPSITARSAGMVLPIGAASPSSSIEAETSGTGWAPT
jgi:di/tricarboxylate transporter